MNLGNLKALVYRNQIISSRILTLGYVVSQIKNLHLNYESSFRFLDLGGGFEIYQDFFYNLLNSKCVLVDIPEVCSF